MPETFTSPKEATKPTTATADAIMNGNCNPTRSTKIPPIKGAGTVLIIQNRLNPPKAFPLELNLLKSATKAVKAG